MTTTTALGAAAEEQAYQYLKSHGLTLIKKNYRVKIGEIDLIMRDKEHTVFVEVKMRHDQSYGDAVEMVMPYKRQRIIRTAKHYLLENNLTERVYGRFDVVGINQANGAITWIKNAFEVQY